MYPHERSLVKRLQGKPFALLGVNSDSDREKLKSVLKDEQITWRSWFDGGGPGGPIARRWQIQFWPSIFVIDAQGVIRAKDLEGPDLDRVLDTLLAELEGQK
jgi:hypothetical protein